MIAERVARHTHFLRNGGVVTTLAKQAQHLLLAARKLADLNRGGMGMRRAQIGKLLDHRSEEHTSELQSLMRISYAVFCLKKKNHKKRIQTYQQPTSNEH